MKPIGADRAVLQYRPDLDGLRAVSCLLVFLFHLLGSKAWHGQLPWIEFLQGWIGVYIFFVLSGFLITSLLVGEERKRGQIRFGGFLIRRELRIVPAYYATIGLYGILCLTPLAGQYRSQYSAGFWYWIAYSGDIATTLPSVGSLFGHSWSLAVEQRFYLVWPFAFFAFSRSWGIRLVIFILAIAAVLFLPVGNVNSYLALLLGSAVALMHARGWGEQILRRTPMSISAGLMLLCIALLHWRPDVITPFCVVTAIFLFHLTVKESRLKRGLSSAPLVWLGQRSYSFYLLHVICLNATLRVIDATSLPGAAAAAIVGIVLTSGAAATSYHLIEEPFRRIGKRLAAPTPNLTRAKRT
jgi:peptidoglycan/LPS O-acetylase OafA/YrhL